jgi:subtilisin family serine protease
VAQHLVRYANSGADVLTAAFGCFTVDGKPPLVLERAIARLTPTVVVVAAAGNYGGGPADGSADRLPQPKTPIWPAAFESVVAVGAADDNGKAAEFSPQVPWVDLIAPGVKVTSDFLQGDVRIVLTDEKTGAQREEVRRFDGTAVWSGTSFAAAAVSGALAAQTVRGRRTAYEALDRVRRGVGGSSRHGIDVATFS